MYVDIANIKNAVLSLLNGEFIEVLEYEDAIRGFFIKIMKDLLKKICNAITIWLARFSDLNLIESNIAELELAIVQRM